MFLPEARNPKVNKIHLPKFKEITKIPRKVIKLFIKEGEPAITQNPLCV